MKKSQTCKTNIYLNGPESCPIWETVKDSMKSQLSFPIFSVFKLFWDTASPNSSQDAPEDWVTDARNSARYCSKRIPKMLCRKNNSKHRVLHQNINERKSFSLTLSFKQLCLLFHLRNCLVTCMPTSIEIVLDDATSIPRNLENRYPKRNPEMWRRLEARTTCFPDVSIAGAFCPIAYPHRMATVPTAIGGITGETNFTSFWKYWFRNAPANTGRRTTWDHTQAPRRFNNAMNRNSLVLIQTRNWLNQPNL